MNEDTRTLLREFNNEVEATMAQQKLEENDIYSFIENQNTTGLTPLGGKRLMVFVKDKEKAAQIISEDTVK